mmetsp:Transcript_1370/g.4649  ORF Transcript_1370/g.4649 Transcript_1370/m.4649 type:complete len:288 (+) Transcript_1370:889-1752(+)
MAADSTSRYVMESPCFSLSSRSSALRSTSFIAAPGRPSTLSLPLSTRLRSGSGKPPSGWPIMPCRNSTTLLGNESVSALSTTSFSSSLFCTMNCARSPTTLLLGVTLTMSPSTWFAAAYDSFTCGHCSARPRDVAWNLRLVYWPPGISWRYTSAPPLLSPLSNGAYSPRACSQYVFRTSCFLRSTPVSSSVPRTASARAPIEGWLVRPEKASVATSTTSAPALAAASMDATPVPAVSCVCTWMGRSGCSLRSAPTSSSAALGLSRPAMSLMQRTSMPWAASFSVSLR